MAASADPTDDHQARERRPVVPSTAVALALLVVTVLVVVLTPLIGSTTVGGRGEQGAVALGAPIAWVHQDQSSLDLPFPSRVTLASPLEHPVTMSWPLFLTDVLICNGLAALLLSVAVQLVRRPGRAVLCA